MTPDQFQIVTALTIGSIGAIILLYFIVLKRKGWLTEEKPSGTSYLCPNPKCKRIFHQPITLTDLSTNPPRSFLACPNCGLDLATISLPKPEKIENIDKIPSQKKLLPPSETFTIRTTESPKPETPVETRIPKTQDAPEPTSTNKVFQGLIKPAGFQEPKSPSQTSLRPIKTDKEQRGKRTSESPRGCSHFFGYVKTLPKNTPIPNECMWCPLIIKCLTGTEKVEA